MGNCCVFVCLYELEKFYLEWKYGIVNFCVTRRRRTLKLRIEKVVEGCLILDECL